MGTHTIRAAGLYMLAASFFVAAFGVPGVLAEDRLVLCEEFTTQGCSGCGYAGPALDQMLDIYADSFAFVQFHVDWFDPNDPNSDPLLVYGKERMEEFYGSQLTPTAVFDGWDVYLGAVSDIDLQYEEYRDYHYLPERATPTDVTLGLDIESLGGQDFRVTVDAGITPEGVGRSMRIYIAQVLDHWPDDVEYYRNGFKQMADTEDITLSPGESEIVQRDLTVDAESWSRQEDIKIIVWAQAALDVGPATVFQAAQRRWPLDPPPDDDDGDGVLDDIDNCPHNANPLQEDEDEDGVGDICDNCFETYNPDQANADEDPYGDICDNCPTLHSVYLDDTDGDGVGDVCDWCPETVLDAEVDEFGRVIGTIDLDCDVDADDFELFAACMAGPGVTTPPGGSDPTDFGRADLDGDGDVDEADFAVFNRQFTGPLPSPAMYIGSASCTDCHTQRHSEWVLTRHAQAYDTLVQSGDETNSLCLACHTVGFRQRSGYVDEEVTPHLKDVQCENCHGPGSNHVSNPGSAPMTRDYAAGLCGSCHQSCHGLCGDDHHPEYENWQESQHSAAHLSLPWEAPQECLECHNTEYIFGLNDPNDPFWFPSLGIECVVCHTPHSNQVNEAQLRQPTDTLCAQCHTMGAAVPDDDPNYPQSEVLHGFGGYELDGTPMVGPYTAHWWDNPDECATCHVAYLQYEDPNSLLDVVDSGHTFRHNLRACEPCHTLESAEILVEGMHFEMSVRLGAIGPYFTEGDPLYIDPEELTPEQRTRYDNAKFNYQMVKWDKSFGSHNPAYARALLDETEEYLELPPWRLFIEQGEMPPPIHRAGGASSVPSAEIK